ncbi:hypothetical protein JTB14_003939 [Gonioctena quinquepunctata]|nr:hypothetical protein JTB14_003939 [Gonioctena quinquepunctata]
MDQKNNDEKKENLIYLDFNGKLPLDVLKKDVFIRIANLHKKDPFVQVNDSVYKGTLDHAMGTNLYFDTVLNSSRQIDNFDKKGSIKFDFISRNTKIINLKQVKVPPKKVKLPKEIKNIEFNLDVDYNTLLKKFADRTLGIEDIIVINAEVKSSHMEIEHEISTNEHVLDALVPSTILEEKYNKLQALARKPMRIETFPEIMEECDQKYKKSHEFDSLKRQIMKKNDYFREEPLLEEIESISSSKYVDIDRCVLYGILKKSSEYPRELTEEEKVAVLTLSNFDNLSLVARLYVLKNQVDNLERDLENKSKSELLIEDEFGRNPLETLEIYRRLRDALKKHLEDISNGLKNSGLS